MSDKENAQELLDTIKECMDSLDRIFRAADRMTYERWKSYPRGNILMALDSDHGYLGDNPFPIQSLIDDLEDDSDDDDDEGEDCPANEIDSIEDETREP